MTTFRKKTYLISFLSILALYGGIMLLMNTGMIGRHQSSILNFICINIILAVSLNVTVGCLGQITLGHAGFMSLGAYTAALISKSAIFSGMPGYFVGLICGGLVAGFISILIGIPALRLKGDYLAIITLGFGEIIRVLIEFFDFTGGAQGLRGIPRMQNFSIIFWIMVISVTMIFTLMTSRHGRIVLAIREDEFASESVGIHTTYAKTFAFVVSAFFAGIAGGMYAHNTGILGAKMFDYNLSINILVMVVLGGMGSFTGATLSAIVLTLLPELLRNQNFADYRMILYSIILIVMMLFRPSGLLGRKEFQMSKLLLLLRKNKENTSQGGDLL